MTRVTIQINLMTIEHEQGRKLNFNFMKNWITNCIPIEIPLDDMVFVSFEAVWMLNDFELVRLGYFL